VLAHWEELVLVWLRELVYIGPGRCMCLVALSWDEKGDVNKPVGSGATQVKVPDTPPVCAELE
jgi:hypothetical protein